VDELEMFGAGDLVGSVLADSSEEQSLVELQEDIRTLINEIGVYGSFRDAVETSTWSRCKADAAKLEYLLNRNQSDRDVSHHGSS
jgi:hypothetical protein